MFIKLQINQKYSIILTATLVLLLVRKPKIAETSQTNQPIFITDNKEQLNPLKMLDMDALESFLCNTIRIHPPNLK